MLEAMKMDEAYFAEARRREVAMLPPISELIVPRTRFGIGRIKIGEKYAVKSGLKPVAIGDQATTECFIRRARKKSFLTKKS
jgi:hypothetical protein